MNIKSLLIGSAAALAAVSGAQAADAIVAAEPEPLEYVRVCDAFGTGFFYIPGTETCLKFGGYIRFQTDFGRNQSGTSDWDSFTRAQFEIDTRTDTELGALRGFIGFRGQADNDTNRGVNVDQAFIELGGLKVGYMYTWWDDDLSGETDILSVHLPLAEDTLGMVDAAMLARLPAHALLLNTARGQVIDQTALLDAIEGGRLAGAALDVLDGEPEPLDAALLARIEELGPRLVVTPHIGGFTFESLEAVEEFMADTFLAAYRALA